MAKYKKKPQKPKAAKTYGKGFKAFASEAVGTGYAVAKVAKKALAGVRAIRKLINVEENYLDVPSVSVSNSQFTSSGYVACLNLMATGDGIGQRTGNSIRPQHLELDVVITNNLNADANTVRCILFVDKQNDGTVPAVTDMLSVSHPQSFYNRITALKRFTILKDSTFVINPTYLTETLYRFTYNESISGHMLYDNTSAAQTSTKEGALFLMLLSDGISGITSPTAYYFSRLAYTDN